MGAFTPDGERAVTVSSDETVRLWNLKTGQEIRQYKGHIGAVAIASLPSEDVRRTSGPGRRTTRCVWDVPQPRLVLSLTGHQGAADGMAIVPTDDWLSRERRTRGRSAVESR